MNVQWTCNEYVNMVFSLYVGPVLQNDFFQVSRFLRNIVLRYAKKSSMAHFFYRDGVCICVIDYCLRPGAESEFWWFWEFLFILFCYPKNSLYLSYLRFAPNDLLLRRLCIPRGNSGTSHSALGSQWLIPLHLISGRPRPLLSPCEHSSLGAPMMIALHVQPT